MDAGIQKYRDTEYREYTKKAGIQGYRYIKGYGVQGYRDTEYRGIKSIYSVKELEIMKYNAAGI